jgi:predicted dehydrogenase
MTAPCQKLFVCLMAFGVLTRIELPAAADDQSPPDIRVGIIGLDTSHVIHFTRILNAEDPPPELAGCRVVAAYPKGSPDIESSVSRVPKYTQEVQEMGVEIVGSIAELLPRVDAVLLETNDGRPHLGQALPVLKAGKRMFIDKPMAASLVDVIAIFAAAKHYGVPVFSTSALRYGEGTLAAHQGSIGPILGCDTYSSCSLEPTHPDFFWYGVHGVEALFTVMGTGCQSVSRTHTAGEDVAVGVWEGGRIGTYRGMRVGKTTYGGIAFGTTGNLVVGTYGGYEPLVVDIVHFFRGGDPATTYHETIEIFAFMEAADLSKERNGTPVKIADLITEARLKAAKKRDW